MEETCESIIGVLPDGTPEKCGMAGLKIGNVVKCREHWARSRRHASDKNRKQFKRYKENELR